MAVLYHEEFSIMLFKMVPPSLFLYRTSSSFSTALKSPLQSGRHSFSYSSVRFLLSVPSGQNLKVTTSARVSFPL